jgi:arylsulfatase A-like enzyme
MADVERGRLYDRLPDARLTLAEALGGIGYRTAAFTAGLTLSPKIGFDQGFPLYRTTMFRLTPRMMAGMKEWVAEQRGEPFFLFWHTFEVHAPYLDRRFLPEVLSPEKLEAVNEALDRQEKARSRGDVLGFGLAKILRRHGVFDRRVCDALYMGSVASTDHWLGDLVETLRRLGLYDGTMIVFTSDHGEELGQRSPDQIYDAHGHTLYEELLRIPLIVKLPDQVRAGTRVGAVTSMVDVMPTILDVLSVSPTVHEMQGRSLRPTWQDPGRAADEIAAAAYAEALGEDHEKKAVRLGRYKYIVSIDARTVAQRGRGYIPAEPAGRELYDLVSDPEERRNLLDPLYGGRHGDLARRLDDALRRHIAAQKGSVDTIELDPETIEKLEALGYVR